MTISVLQYNQASSGAATATTEAVAFTSNCTAGSYLYCAAVQNSSTSYTATCSDTLNGSYTQLNDTTVSGSAIYHFWVYCPTGGANTVTVTFSSASAYRGIFIAEIGGSSGLDTAGTYHAGNYQASPGGGTNAVTSGTLTPSVQPGLAVGVTFDANLGASFTAGTGFTAFYPTANTFWTFTTGANRGQAEYQVYSSTSSVPATFTASTGGATTGTVGALFKQATLGPFAYVEGYTQGITYDTNTSYPAFTNSVAVNDLIVVALNLISYSSFSPVVSDNVNTGNYIIANNFNNTASTQGWVYLYMPCNASCGANTLVITVYANNSHYGGGQSSALHFNGFTTAPTLDTSATAFYNGTAASVSQSITNTTTPELLIGQLWSGNVQTYTGGMTPTNLGGAGALQSPAYSNLGSIVAETYSATFTSNSYGLYLVGFYNSSAPSPTLLGQICL